MDDVERMERATLGCMLLDENAINDATEVLVASDFLLDSHQRIYTCICDLVEVGNSVDTLTVMEDLTRRKWLDSVGGAAYLAHLTEGVPRNASVADYVRIVKDKSLLRQLLGIFNEGMVAASDQSEDANTVMSNVDARLAEIANTATRKSFTTLLDAVAETGSLDEYMSRMCDPKLLTGVATGFIEIDKVWGGMQKANLIIVAARPSMGKSAWLFNTAVNVTTSDRESVVALFSLEMSKEAFFKRIVASVAEVSARRAQEGHIDQQEKAQMTRALVKLADLHIHIDDTAEMTPMQMRAKARRLKQQMGRLDLIGVDYLQLIRGAGKHGNRQEEVSSVSRALKAMSKELECPVVALAQLSRKNEERGDKRPMLSDLRESGSIEQDADIVAFIHRAEYYAADDDENVERGVAEFITAKNREGQTGMRKLAYRGEYTRFGNLEIYRGDPRDVAY